MTKLKRFFKQLIITCIILLTLTVTFIWCCNHWIIHSTEKQVYSDIDSIPFRKVGLVLGTNESWHGGENPFFKYRIEAADALYKAGKIKYIIVSGDNHVKSYDEPTEMKNALVKLGVPDSVIYLDYAGFRTFDSMIRCKDIFGQDTVTIISQHFHNERALFLANYFKMTAVAYNAKDVSSRLSFTESIREYFAKCKAILDLYILNTEPKFLGPRVKIG